jgi:hypothetical protein
MDKIPLTIIEMEYAAEVAALVQPNSSNTGSKKIPKLRKMPQDIVMIKKTSATMT